MRLGDGGSGSATVTGSGSRLEITSEGLDALIVGEDGTGTLNVNNGGVVSSGGNARIGLESGSSGNVTVADSGSLWDMHNITVGVCGHRHVGRREWRQSRKHQCLSRRTVWFIRHRDGDRQWLTVESRHKSVSGHGRRRHAEYRKWRGYLYWLWKKLYRRRNRLIRRRDGDRQWISVEFLIRSVCGPWGHRHAECRKWRGSFQWWR